MLYVIKQKVIKLFINKFKYLKIIAKNKRNVKILPNQSNST